MATKAKKAKKKAATKKFWAVRLFKDREIQIYSSKTRPTVVPCDFNVEGTNLTHVLELCEAAVPLFSDLKVGEVKEVTVNLG